MTGNLIQLFPIIALFGVMYFLLIRPQQKQQRELGNMQSKLKKHDEVVTSGGLYGTVVNIKERSITLRVDDNVRIEFDRSSITRLVKEG